MSSLRNQFTASVSLFVLLAFGPAHAQGGSSAVVNGPNALSEVYGAWTVQCATAAPNGGEPVRSCWMWHRQNNEQGNLVLSVELREGQEGLSGLSVLPFGIAVQDPVRISAGEGASPIELQVSTCMPVGCLVPIPAGIDPLDAYGNAERWVIEAVDIEGQTYTFTVPLLGFAPAHDRLAVLDNS